MTKQEKIQQVTDSLIRNSIKKTKCVIVVNNRTKNYECLETNFQDSGRKDGDCSCGI